EIALAALRVEQTGALYWATVAWAAAIASDKRNMDLIADLPLIAPMMRRCMALDETYRDGAADEFMIAFEGGRGEVQGGSVARAREHFAHATALSGGRRVSIMVSLAEHVAVRVADRGEFEDLLHQAIAFDVDTAPQQRLANLIAHPNTRRHCCSG
ncbi:MAG: TRAP transporter TatT component family protein, partial [Alphaproteobacteria bacterium]